MFAQSPAEVVIPAVIRFSEAIWKRCHLQLQWEKSAIFSWSGKLPEGSPTGVKLAGRMIDDRFENGFDCYGVPIGSEKYITSEIKDIAVSIANDAMKTVEVLSTNKQALWAALRLSVSQRFQYICQHVQPSLCEPVAGSTAMAYTRENCWIPDSI